MNKLMYGVAVGCLLFGANVTFAWECTANCADGNDSSVQTQQQQQDQDQTATGGNQRQTATGGNASIASGAVSNTNTVTGGVSKSSSSSVSTTGPSTSTSSAESNGNGDESNNTTVESVYKSPKIPVATAYSAALTSGLDTCLGSLSGGAQTSVLGLTIGGTKRDKNCETIKTTHLIAEFSRTAACFYMLKNIQGVSDAFKDANVVCTPPPPPEVTVSAAPPVDYVTQEQLKEIENRITTHLTQK